MSFGSSQVASFLARWRASRSCAATSAERSRYASHSARPTPNSTFSEEIERLEAPFRRVLDPDGSRGQLGTSDHPCKTRVHHARAPRADRDRKAAPRL